MTFNDQPRNQRRSSQIEYGGVPKKEDKWNQPGEMSTLERDVWSIACGYNNTQRVEYSSPRFASFLKSILTCVPAVSNSDASLHWPLRLNRFPVYQFAFRMEHHSTKCHRQEKHRCNSVWLAGHAPSKLAELLKFFPTPHPSSKRSAYRDPRWSECRFRFFLANERVQFIQLSFFDLRGHGSLWQFGCILIDPISDALWIDLEHSPNWTKTAAFHIHANCQQACFLGITMLGWLRCIHPIAFTAPITLAPGRIEACFVLFPVRLAVWTFHASDSILFLILGSL